VVAQALEVDEPIVAVAVVRVHWAFSVGSGQAVVDVGSIAWDAERRERLPLDGEVLPVGRDTGIADQQRVDGCLRQ